MPASAGDGSSRQPDPEAEMGEEKAAAHPGRKEAFGSNPQAEDQGFSRTDQTTATGHQRGAGRSHDAAQAAAATAATDPATKRQSDPRGQSRRRPACRAGQHPPVPAELTAIPRTATGRVYASPLRPSNQHRATTDGQSIQNRSARPKASESRASPATTWSTTAASPASPDG